jgi:hypothetical protein
MSNDITDLIPSPPQIRCREVLDSDIENIINLLTKGFYPKRKRAHWVDAMQKLAAHPTPPGLPRYGYLLDCNGVPVGVLILIFSSHVVDGISRLRSSVSSWYVDKEFRTYATLLASQAVKHKNVTYSNISASRHTWPILQLQGYVRFSSGQTITLPILSHASRSARVIPITAATLYSHDLPQTDVALLKAHASYGCISLICKSANNVYPFIFRRRLMFAIVPVVHLIYCRDVADFVQFAGVLGRYLSRRGILLVDVDADGPVPGVVGKYRDNRPKYCKGPEHLRAGDLAYTELALFGF